jgi:hypothetical protein
MNLAQEHLAAAGSVTGTAVIVAFGLLVTSVLVWSARLGHRVRRREGVPPRRRERPAPPPSSGPVHERRQMREPNEVPKADEGHGRLTPHRLGNAPSRRSRDQSRRRWRSGVGAPTDRGGRRGAA